MQITSTDITTIPVICVLHVMFCVHIGQTNGCDLDSDCCNHELPDDAIEDTDRSDNLFRRKSDRDEILQACEKNAFIALLLSMMVTGRLTT